MSKEIKGNKYKIKRCSIHAQSILVDAETDGKNFSLQMSIVRAEYICKVTNCHEGLLNALQPFADFACDDWQTHKCLNCIAKQVIAEAK